MLVWMKMAEVRNFFEITFTIKSYIIFPGRKGNLEAIALL